MEPGSAAGRSGARARARRSTHHAPTRSAERDTSPPSDSNRHRPGRWVRTAPHPPAKAAPVVAATMTSAPATGRQAHGAPSREPGSGATTTKVTGAAAWSVPAASTASEVSHQCGRSRTQFHEGSDVATPIRRRDGGTSTASCPMSQLMTRSVVPRSPTTPRRRALRRSTVTGTRRAVGRVLVGPSTQVTSAGRSPSPSRSRCGPGCCHRPGCRCSAVWRTRWGSGLLSRRRAHSRVRWASRRVRASAVATRCAARASRCSRPAPNRSASALPSMTVGPSSANASIWGPRRTASSPATGIGTRAPTHGTRVRLRSPGSTGAVTTGQGCTGRGRWLGRTVSRPSPVLVTGNPAPGRRRRARVEAPTTIVDEVSTLVGPSVRPAVDHDAVGR